VDAQAGLEVGITLVLSVAAGADIFGHMGISGVDQAASPDMLVMQNEAISYIESVVREIDFSDGALGISAIEEAGPGGNFIATTHTAEHFRREMWFPRLLDRDFYQAWLDGNAEDMQKRCRARKEEILAGHRSPPVPAELEKALDEIVSAARRELG